MLEGEEIDGMPFVSAPPPPPSGVFLSDSFSFKGWGFAATVILVAGVV